MKAVTELNHRSWTLSISFVAEAEMEEDGKTGGGSVTWLTFHFSSFMRRLLRTEIYDQRKWKVQRCQNAISNPHSSLRSVPLLPRFFSFQFSTLAVLLCRAERKDAKYSWLCSFSFFPPSCVNSEIISRCLSSLPNPVAPVWLTLFLHFYRKVICKFNVE